MIKVGGQVFSLPLTSVNEIFYLELNNVRVVDGQSTVIMKVWLQLNLKLNHKKKLKFNSTLKDYR